MSLRLALVKVDLFSQSLIRIFFAENPPQTDEELHFLFEDELTVGPFCFSQRLSVHNFRKVAHVRLELDSGGNEFSDVPFEGVDVPLEDVDVPFELAEVPFEVGSVKNYWYDHFPREIVKGLIVVLDLGTLAEVFPIPFVHFVSWV